MAPGNEGCHIESTTKMKFAEIMVLGMQKEEPGEIHLRSKKGGKFKTQLKKPNILGVFPSLFFEEKTIQEEINNTAF